MGVNKLGRKIRLMDSPAGNELTKWVKTTIKKKPKWFKINLIYLVLMVLCILIEFQLKMTFYLCIFWAKGKTVQIIKLN